MRHHNTGYANAAVIAKTAYKDNSSLREATLKLGLLSAEAFDRHVRPELMLGPSALAKSKDS